MKTQQLYIFRWCYTKKLIVIEYFVPFPTQWTFNAGVTIILHLSYCCLSEMCHCAFWKQLVVLFFPSIPVSLKQW